MSKEILLITGSPRKGGNSDQLADAFIRGAEAAGRKVYKFAAAFKDVHGCRGCDMCWSSGSDPCVVKDDFYEIVPLIKKCETLILASPIYFWGFTAQIKAVIDRLYPFAKAEGRKYLGLKESALLLALGDSDEATYKHTSGSYKDIVEYMGWKDLGVVAAKGVNKKQDILKSDALRKAEELGRGV
jgi:multimeric flavodoxin WrbA